MKDVNRANNSSTKKVDPDKYFKTIMHRTRQDLNPLDRAASQLLHNTFLDWVYEAVTKTIFRPVSLLTAIIVTASGLALVYYLARFTGFALSGSEFLLLFSSGYILGLIIEFFTFIIKRCSSKKLPTQV